MDNQNLNQSSPVPSSPSESLVPPVPSMTGSPPAPGAFDPPKKKFPIVLVIIILFVVLSLAAGLYLYSTQAEKLSDLNNQTQFTPPTPLVQDSVSPTPTLDAEADGIVIEDPEADFTALDADLSSL